MVIQASDSVLLVLSGIGAERAAHAARLLLESGAQALLSWGSAAALDPALCPGTLLLPTEIIASDGNRLPVTSEWHARVLSIASHVSRDFSIRTEAVAESAAVLVSPHEKLTLLRQSGALGADMESAAIARAAQERGVPFLAVRAVSDDCDTALPFWLIPALDSLGRAQPLRLCAGLLRHPGDILTLTRLSHGFQAALSTLSGLKERAGRELFASPRRLSV
jgi:adenosylhomocysteine nucleosidase